MGQWQLKVIPIVSRKLSRYSYRPTVRGMFYSLVSDNVIPNVHKSYKGLVSALGTARRNGSLPLDAFADNVRHIEDIDDIYQTPEQYVDNRIEILKTSPETYFDYIPRWHKQKHYVEIMVEKDALRNLFTEIVENAGLQLRVVPNGGWSSIDYRQKTFNRLLRKSTEDKDDDGNPIKKEFHILYFGDYDPTGRRMDMNMSIDLALLKQGYRGRQLEVKSKKLRKGIESYDGEIYDYIVDTREYRLFERITLTKNQIDEFGLQNLKNPDPEVLDKLKQDPNAHAFILDNGSLFQIELDALQKESIADRFKQLVIDSVNKYFDQQIYEKMIKEHNREELKHIVRSKAFGEFD